MQSRNHNSECGSFFSRPCPYRASVILVIAGRGYTSFWPLLCRSPSYHGLPSVPFCSSLISFLHSSRMMLVSTLFALGWLLMRSKAQEIINGQIFTPGIVIVDAPQPNTPMGGNTLHLALDVSSNGQLSRSSTSKIYNITIFLSSYTTGLNLTVTNGTASTGNASLGDITQQEPGSTVKHVNWVWPDCLVGDGSPSGKSSRGLYNISIRQNFRLNGTDAYTIFDLPIHVTNSISQSSGRPSCESLSNPLISQEALAASASNFTRIAGTGIASDDKGGDGLGGSKPEGAAADGLGAGEMLEWRSASHWMWIGMLAWMLAV